MDLNGRGGGHWGIYPPPTHARTIGLTLDRETYLHSVLIVSERMETIKGTTASENIMNISTMNQQISDNGKVAIARDDVILFHRMTEKGKNSN